MGDAGFEPLRGYRSYAEDEMLSRAESFRSEVSRRRTVRHFSERPVPRAIVEACLRAAGSAPSGANQQPWHFVAVSDPATKRRIRIAAEAREHEFYHGRAPRQWLDAVAPFGTNEHKPYLETAPWLLAVFGETHQRRPDGGTAKNYYVTESVGIATGLLIAALHHAGLATLTHTPSPMRFLNELLGRPDNERPFLLLVAGYPAEGALVPVLTRKPLDRIATFI